ncbi:MAG: DUF2182 domain-containing protein [Pseudonocardiaceae bacterium]|nr:DUF2182 domain-containing protein [Pseudonocardiaceae bacterium]
MTDRSSAVRRMGVTLAWRPEWPVAVIVVMAWVALIAIHASSSMQGAHAAHVGAAAPTALLAAVGGWALVSWALMSVAMMVPVTLPAVRHVGLNSIRRRRRRAMALYAASYVAVWVAFGVLALVLVAALRSTGPDERLLVLGTLVIAALWQLTRWKRRAVVACQRTVPLPPTGWRADAGCVRFGVRQAGRCVVSCGPLMLLMAVIGHGNLVVMAALTVGIVAERRTSIRGRLAVPVGGALAAAAVWTVLFSGAT